MGFRSSFFEPDRYFDRLSSVDVERDVLDLGFKVALLDIDNTLRSRADGLVPSDVSAWLQIAKSKGVKLCLLSNNWHADVYDFARSLDVPVIAKACKPLPFAYVRALRRFNVSAEEALMVGDQLSTDVWGAHLMGMRAYLVQPLAMVDLRHTRYVRKLESGFLSGVALETSATKNASDQSCIDGSFRSGPEHHVVRDANNTCEG